MKKPPPITDFYRYPVSAGVSLLAVFVTVLDATGRSIGQLVMSVRAFEREPWRLVSSALPHGNALHLLFNVAWVWTLGTVLEDRFGSPRLLGLVTLFAAGSAAAEYAIFEGGIGLSGVVYGLYGMLWVLSRADGKLRGVADSRTTQLFIVWFFFCIAATSMGVLPIANVAHGVGALLGLLVGLAITGGLRMGRRRASVQVAGALATVLVLAASYAGATVLRPRVNFSKHGGEDSAELGDDALDDKAYDEAIKRYRASLQVSPKNARTWYSLGVALWHGGDVPASVGAFARAHELDPENPQYKSTLVNTKRTLAYRAETRGDDAEAARLYEESLALGGDDYISLYHLGQVYFRLGRKDDAARLGSRAAALEPSVGEVIEVPGVDFDAGAKEDATP